MATTNMRAVLQLEAEAEDFHHLILWLDARLAGLSDKGIDGLCRSGRWRRVGTGVLAVAGKDGGDLQALHAALLSRGPRAFTQRLAAVAVLGRLDIEWDGVIDVAN